MPIHTSKAPLFAPIFSGKEPNAEENLKGLRWTTGFFNFGQMSYRINTLQKGQAARTVCLEETLNQKPTWFGVALRIVTCFTLIIPFFMMMCTLVYRAANKLEVKKIDEFSELPKDIKNVIFNLAFLDVKSLSQVNKDVNTSLKIHLDFERNKLIENATIECLKAIRLMGGPGQAEGFRVLADYYQQAGYKEKAIAYLECAVKRNPDYYEFIKILKVAVNCDIKVAEQMARDRGLLPEFAYALLPVDYEKAEEFYSLHLIKPSSEAQTKFLRARVIETAKFDLEEGLKILNTMGAEQNLIKINAITEIIEMIEQKNPEKAKQLFDEIPINELGDGKYPDWYQSPNWEYGSFFVKHYVKYNRVDEAILFASNIEDINISKEAFASLFEEYVKINPEDALQRALGLQAVNKFVALLEIAKVTKDSTKAKELIEQVWNESLLNTNKLIIRALCSECMAIIDLDRAIEMANLGPGHDNQVNEKALIRIIRQITSQNLPRAMQLAHQVFKIGKTNSDRSIITKFNTFYYLAEALRAK